VERGQPPRRRIVIELVEQFQGLQIRRLGLRGSRGRQDAAAQAVRVRVLDPERRGRPQETVQQRQRLAIPAGREAVVAGQTGDVGGVVAELRELQLVLAVGRIGGHQLLVDRDRAVIERSRLREPALVAADEAAEVVVGTRELLRHTRGRHERLEQADGRAKVVLRVVRAGVGEILRAPAQDAAVVVGTRQLLLIGRGAGRAGSERGL
jgi:hypothetical protein